MPLGPPQQIAPIMQSAASSQPRRAPWHCIIGGWHLYIAPASPKPPLAQQISVPAMHDIMPQSILPGVDMPPPESCVIPESPLESVMLESVGDAFPSDPPSAPSVLPPHATSVMPAQKKKI